MLSVTGLTPFSLFRALGEAAPNHGIALDVYARQVYDCFHTFPNVDIDVLKDIMTCDWLSMVKGKNMPLFLKRQDEHRKYAGKIAENTLGRSMHRDESVVLLSGRAVFVDSMDRDPVSGLYRLHYIDIK
jgi:hypothetical protein